MIDKLKSILDETFPGVSALDFSDDNAAVSSFAAFFRSYLDSTRDRFFSIPYENPENVYKLPGESEEEACRRICSGTLVSVGVPSYFGSVRNVDWHSNPTYNGYKEWTWQFSRHNDVKLLAHQFNLTGKKEYAESAEILLSSWIDTCPRPGADVPGNETDTWRTIECGIRMGANWPYIIYSFYNAFSDELLTKIAVSLDEHGDRLEHNHMHGNWLLMEMNGLCHIAILFPFLKRASFWKEFSLTAMEKEAQKQFYPDGFQYELTTCYHEVAVNNYQRLLELLKAFDVKAPESLSSIMEKAAEVDVMLMEGDGCLPDINDGSASEVSSLLKPKMRLFVNPVLSWGATREGKEPPYKSVALPYSGFFVFRSGWKEDDVYALFDSAPFGRGHQHEDKLSLIVSNGRKRVITEGGCYAYDDSPMRMHTISSGAHNVLLIDGMGQNRRKSYEWHDEEINQLSDLAYGISGDVEWAEGSYDGPYGDGEEYPARWKRAVYFLKKNIPVFIVVDRIEAESEHEYCFLWHFDDERKAIGRQSASYSEASISFSSDGNLSVSRGSMHPVAGYIATGKEQGMYKAVDRLEYRVNAASCRIVTAIALSDKPVSIKASSRVNDEDILVITDDEEVVINEKNLRI